MPAMFIAPMFVIEKARPFHSGEIFLRFLARGVSAIKDALTCLDIALVMLTFVERMAAGASMARSLPSIRLLRCPGELSNACGKWIWPCSWHLSVGKCNEEWMTRGLWAARVRLLRLIRAFKRMRKSKELVVLLSGTSKAARPLGIKVYMFILYMIVFGLYYILLYI